MEIDGDRVRETLLEYATMPVLAVLFVFMLSVRLMPMDRVFTSRGIVYSGNDGWYHRRIVHQIVEHFPTSPPFDVWSRFPYGTGRHSGFGGLFDQLIAAAAILLGGGSPSTELVDATVAVAPAVFGAATVLPVYFVTRAIADRWTGLLASVFLALTSGQFLTRTVIGSPDHQSAEALFGTIAVAGLIASLVAAYRYKPTTAHLRDRDLTGLKPFLAAAAVGGAGIASYTMVWPPGVMLIFTFGVFAVLQMIRDHMRDGSTEYTMFGIAAPLLVAAVITALYAKDTGLSATGFSLLQPLVAGGIAVGVVYLHLLSQYLKEKDAEPASYPVAVAGSIAAGFAGMALLYPQGIDMFASLVTRIYSFGILTSAGAQTVAEISPANPLQAWQSFGFLFLFAAGALALLVYRVVMKDRPLELLLLLWSLTMFSAYFTMVRFGYYVAVNVAILSALLLAWFVKEIVDIDLEALTAGEIRGYEVLILLTVVMVLVPGNVVALGGTSAPVWETAPDLSGANGDWLDELDWMQNNTPAPPMEYQRYFEVPEDGDYDYPVDPSPLEGAYGVMSWWDYGHWITVRANRIPVANPFQENQRAASDFLTAQSEERANLILDALPSLFESDETVDNMSSDELRDIIDDQSPQERHEDTRYVVIDDQSAGGKYNAIATWTGFTGYVARERFQYNNRSMSLPGTTDRYHNSTLGRLYFGDADGMGTYRLVHESETFSVIGSITNTRRINRIVLQRRYDRPFQPGTRLQMKDLGDLPDGQMIPIGGRQSNRLLYDIKAAASVKTFEHVEGATITGTANVSQPTPVSVAVPLRTTNTNRSFAYTRRSRTDSSGDFAIEVAYPTRDDVAVSEGGTNDSVEASGDYQVIVGNTTFREVSGATTVLGQATERGRVAVPESAVYEGESVPVQLEPVENQRTQRSGNRTAAPVAGSAGASDGG